MLFNASYKPVEGSDPNWLGAPMWWSAFSNTWYEITLKELGFDFMMKTKETRIFNGEEEVTYYLLFKNKEEKT